MEVNTTSLLPYVLDLLSRKPDLSSTTDELCEHMKDVILEDVISPFGSLQRAVEFAIELGMNIGLLSLSEHKVLMPFRLKPNATDSTKTTLPPTQCRSLIKRLAKSMRTERVASGKTARALVKAKSKAKKATNRGGATRRPLTARGVKKRGSKATTTTRSRK